MTENMQEISPSEPYQNWTRFPNNILDNLSSFTPHEFMIVSLMIRKTVGYSRPNHEFSISYISLKTGFSRPTVIKATNKLIEKKAIKKLPNGSRGISKFSVIWSTSKKDLLVNKDDQSSSFTSISKECLPDLVKEIYPLKENIEIKHKKDNCAATQRKTEQQPSEAKEKKSNLTGFEEYFSKAYKDHMKKKGIDKEYIINFGRDRKAVKDQKLYETFDYETLFKLVDTWFEIPDSERKFHPLTICAFANGVDRVIDKVHKKKNKNHDIGRW